MASKCRKFVPNIFHKSKCQNCFAAKDIHSAQALENNKASRKPTIFGYLFVSPDLDFSNPLDKAKRWQRRFFVLYDDGELTFSVDENPDTVPQGEVDMNKCVDVYDAESITGHQYSLAVAIPEKIYFIKGNGKEEISRWYEVLVVYPRSIKTTKRKFRSDRETSQSLASDNSQNFQSESQYNFGASLKNNYQFERFDIDKLKSSTPTTYRGVRSLKHKNDKHYTEGLRKSNSLHDLSSNGKIPCSNLESSKYLSRSGDNLNFIPIVDNYKVGPQLFEGSDSRRASDSGKSDSPVPSCSPSSKSSNGEKSGHRSRRGSFDEKRASPICPRTPTNRSISLLAEKPTNSREFSSRLSLPKTDSDIDIDGPPTKQRSKLPPDDNVILYSSRNNETDELKMAKSSEMNAAAKQKDLKTERKIEDMMYMKKGWLIKQGSTEKDWKKHWFVLDANSLRYFEDAKAEENNVLDGKIDLSTCYLIEEIEVLRNYGFSIKNQNGEYVLTAMTSGLRKNWMQAIKICVEMLNWKEPPKGLRRHHSDVNPGNVGKALMIHQVSKSSSSGYFKSIDSALVNSKENKESLSQKNLPSSEYAVDYMLPSKSQKSGSSSTGTSNLGSGSNWLAPIGRYVEGSDNALLSGDLHKKKLERSENRYLPHRTKSPSARVKDKTRSKLPKLLSPPPETEQQGYKIDSYSAHVESGSSEEYHHSAGLVETLRERLDHTEQELVQLHQDKMDLKTQLRNVCSEKENSKSIEAKNLPQTLKRQLKEAKDIIQRQKSEVDVLKSKLDMSVSKLTGTEKALSEALKELKQEKEQYIKMSSDWAKRVKTLDAQLRETSQKLEKSRDALQTKEKECKRLETEVKLNMQKLRDSEREVIKLKAVEVEYRQAKERLDNNHRELECLRKSLKEKDIRCRKLEDHIEEIKQEFRQEKANFERDLSKMKEKMDDSADTMSQSLTSDISSILNGKNAIINQLEEKLIESHNKIEEISEEMQEEIEKGAALRPQLDAALKENLYLKERLDLLENTLMSLQKKMETDEKEKLVLKKQVEEQQREGQNLLSKLEVEHRGNADLQEENADLKNLMINLNDQLQGHRIDVDQLVEQALQEKEGIYKQKLSEISTSLTSGRSLVSMVNSLLSQIMDTQKKDYSHVLASAISSAADLESCLSTAQSVIEDLPPLTKSEAAEQGTAAKEQSEIASIKLQLNEAIKENANLHKELHDAYSDFSRLEAEDKNSRERAELLENDYNRKLNELSRKIDDLNSKLHLTGGESRSGGHHSSSPHNFESQLEDLEKRIHYVGSVIKSQQMQSKVLNRQLLHSCGDDDDASNLSEDSETSEELSDEEFDSEIDDIEDDDNARIISSLRHMNSQVSSTNTRLHDVTQNLSKSSTGSGSSPKKAGLQERLHSCEQKICHLTNQLSMENEFAEIPEGKTVNEIKLAFHSCLTCVQSKLVVVNEEVRAIESAGTKQQANKLTPKIKDKLCYLIRYIKHMQSLTEDDWYILGRLQVKKASVVRRLQNRLEDTKPDSGKADKQILAYAEKLALEVAILGELAYLLQNNYLTNRCVDNLWKEINEVNQLFLQVQEKVMKDMEECQLDKDTELLSNYVKMLSQKIVVEGHLISSLGIERTVLADQAEKSEDISDLPCLATEAISRTLACEYMEHQFHYLGDQLEKFSGHFTAQALLQGEMTYALINLKEKITQQMADVSDEFINEETKTAFVKLKEQEKICYEIVQKYKEQKLQQIQDIVKCSSGKQNVILVVSQVHRLLQTHIKQYEDMLEPSLPTSRKCQIIHNSLKIEQDSFLKTMQTTLQEYEEIESHEKEFMDNIKSHLMELADVLVLNATIRGQVTYISELYSMKFGASPSAALQDRDVDSSISDDERRWENLMKKLGSVLMGEAKIKSQAAFQLVDECSVDIDQGRIQEIKELLLCVPSVQGYCPHRLTNYSDQVIREAAFQAQMCYLMEKLKLEYEEEINQLRILNSGPNMKNFQSQDGRECEVDMQALMQVFEMIFEQKYKDEMGVFSALKKEIDSLKYVAPEGTDCNECVWSKELIDNLEKVFNEQYSKAKGKHELHAESFKEEIASVSMKVKKMFEDRDREKETLVSDYEDRISLLQDEFDCLTVERDEELAQVKMDIMTAVGAIQASEHQTETQRCEQVKQLTRNIAMQKYYFNVLIDEVKLRISDPKLMQKIEHFQQNLQFPSNENLKDELDVEQTDRFLSANNSFELSKDDAPPAGDGDKHEQQMAKLMKEKDDALAQEAKLTKAALESMSKAYEDNLETEKNKFREALKTMYTEDYVNEIRRHHELEVGKLQEELKTLNLHYTSKCEDYKMLEDRLNKSKTEQNEHMKKLLASNEQLTTLVAEELTELKELVKKRSPRGLPAGSSSLEEDLYEAQIMNRMKDSDIQKLRSQVTAGDINLQRITEEHKQVMTQYLHCKKLYSALQEENNGLKSKLEKAIGETKPDQNSLQRRQQPVRRVPSFHHRARSPSPSHSSSQRKEEHISRDSHKGRRYQAKDIRRSRSSPSLPFVFGSKQLLGEKSLLASKDSLSGMSSTCRR